MGPRAKLLDLSRNFFDRAIGPERQALKQLHNILAGDKKILVGPWLSEVGFELLYWIPMLQMMKERYDVSPDRLHVLSRGGVSDWYHKVSHNYHEIFDVMTVDEYRYGNKKRIAAAGGQKHFQFSELDKVLIDRVSATLQSEHFEVLHPSLMYRLLLPLWRLKRSADFPLRFLSFSRIELNENMALDLPESFVAAKVYFSDALPRSPENLSKIRKIVQFYAERTPVILLSAGIQVDEHVDAVLGDIPNLRTISAPAAQNNLELQTAIVMRSRELICTYGGFSYLGPLLGVPTTCFFSDLGRVAPIHLDVALRAFRYLSYGEASRLTRLGAGEPDGGARFTPVSIDMFSSLT